MGEIFNNFEVEYLKRVQDAIKNEIEYLLKELEEIPYRYKNRYANAKWGDDDLVAELQNTIRKRLEKLKNLSQNPYFGKIEFSEDGHSREYIYIGKTTITDKHNKILVTDWRAPICTLYYNQNLGRVSYEAPLGTIHGELSSKQQIIIENGQITAVRDNELVTTDELLAAYLNTNADSRLKTIVASIQSEQDAIIRKPLRENIMVQGVAGSGKTTVAIHRDAYLIFSNDQYNARNFVIIGPNKYFLDYISSLLPDLDTENVTQFTFEEIAFHVLGDDKIKIEKSENRDNKLTGIMGYKSTLEYKDDLKRFLDEYFNTLFDGGIVLGRHILFSEEQIRQLFNNGLPFLENVRNVPKTMIKRIKDNYEEILKKLIIELQKKLKLIPSDKKNERQTIIDQMNFYSTSLKNGCSDIVKQYFKRFNISLLSLYREFILQSEKYLPFDEKSTLLFKKETLKSIKTKVFPFEDLGALMYLSTTLNGVNKSEFKKFTHVTIDEAQDYGLFHYYMLKTIFQNCSYSIFGDLAQAIYPRHSVASWDELNDQIFDSSFNIINLNRSYRTTMEITTASNLILQHLKLQPANPVIRTGEDVSIVEQELNRDSLLNFIFRCKEKGYKSVSIICRGDSELEKARKILAQANIQSTSITKDDATYTGGICILDSSLAKGLEFDTVLIVNASEKNYKYEDENDMRLLYVAMTRALHELSIFYSDKLPRIFQSYGEKGRTRIIERKDSNGNKFINVGL